MINCYVIGDFLSVENLRTYISNCSNTKLCGYSIDKVTGLDLIYSTKPDIVFIESSFFEGKEFWLDQIRQYASVILISDDVNLAYHAFEQSAFDYFIKPISLERFVKSILKFERIAQLNYFSNKPKNPEPIDSFFIKVDSKGCKEVLIKCDQLLYIKALQNYVLLYMENGKCYSCHNSMKEMEEGLSSSSFTRVHKSFMINENKITSVEGNMVVLNYNEDNKILIGNSYRKGFFDRKNQKVIRKQKEKVGISLYR